MSSPLTNPNDGEEWEQFERDRFDALLSLDEVKIRAYMAKWDIPSPSNPMNFWAGVHKARVMLKTMPGVERAKSISWLTYRGFAIPPIG